MCSFTNKQLTNNLKITVEVIKATPSNSPATVQQQETIKMNQNIERNQKKNSNWPK